MARGLYFLACILFLAGSAAGQANGSLQIHHMDVGQGDGAILISPGGQVVLFDAGEDSKKRDCAKTRWARRSV
jgi:beta-lactamase superfamily II metal-dependent hydrolase